MKKLIISAALGITSLKGFLVHMLSYIFLTSESKFPKTHMLVFRPFSCQTATLLPILKVPSRGLIDGKYGD